jgi:hypothetical protein
MIEYWPIHYFLNFAKLTGETIGHVFSLAAWQDFRISLVTRVYSHSMRREGVAEGGRGR